MKKWYASKTFWFNVLEQETLWKCHSCGKVHHLKDTLECAGCGQPITAKSRFVLE
jgi:ribosomal protein L37E